VARILIDTSAVYALIDRSDRWHATAKASLEDIKKARSEPLLTNLVVAECHALILVRLGAPLARKWLTSNVWSVQRVTVDDEARAMTIITKYIDKAFSCANATSFAVMERLGIQRAFAFDPHFRQYGFDVIGLPPS
jgi:predicted nucleic acid-binding protein